MIIKNDKDLEKFLLQEIKTAIQEVGDEIAKDLTDNIQQSIYNEPPSSYYKRTKDFINAVIHPVARISGNTVEATVGMDWTHITPDFRNIDGNAFNAHMSIDGNPQYNEQSIQRSILEWYDIGTTNNYLPSVPETNYWYDVFGDRANDNPNYKKLEKLINEKISEHLEKFGIVTKK